MPDLKPWYAIATPHEDIRKGKLAEAIFAANLAQHQSLEHASFWKLAQALFEVLPHDAED
ncbi:MAG: hypothetical protein KGJ80_13055 [Chloroflexota bacterium]|nr:hypothetical protein [Chloroflexota bacterium]